MKPIKSLWRRELGSLIKEKTNMMPYSVQDVSGKITEKGEFGEKTKPTGYRSAIFYFKLSTLLDQEITSEAIKEITRKMKPRSKHRFATLFLNNSVNELIYPRSMVTSENAVNQTMIEYYKKYACQNELYSGIMEQIFPRLDLYVKHSYPGTNDLCVIFTDRYGIEIAPSLINKINKIKNNWLLISADKNRAIEITEMKEIL